MADTDTSTNETQSGMGDNAAPKPAEKTYTKTEHTAKIKEVETALTRERDALAAKLAEYEAEKAKAEEAKMSAEQRRAAEAKRERDKLDAELNGYKTAAAQERAKRHEVMRAGKASSLAATIAADIANPGLVPYVERAIADRVVVVDDGHGNETLMLRMGAEGDNEAVETAFPKLRDTELKAFFRTATGSGAQHGAGGIGGKPKQYATMAEAVADKIRAQQGRR